MTHVSKHKLGDAEQAKLFEQMYSLFARLDSKNAPFVMSELLGNEEKIMLAKRLAAILLITRGDSAYRVWTLLKISPSTADRIRLDCERGRYRTLQKFFVRNKKDLEQMVSSFLKIIHFGLPPRGAGKWKRDSNGDFIY